MIVCILTYGLILNNTLKEQVAEHWAVKNKIQIKIIFYVYVRVSLYVPGH